jgi:hypothetical protein
MQLGCLLGSPHFTVAGGTFAKTTNTYPFVPAVPLLGYCTFDIGLQLSSVTDRRYSSTYQAYKLIGDRVSIGGLKLVANYEIR